MTVLIMICVVFGIIFLVLSFAEGVGNKNKEEATDRRLMNVEKEFRAIFTKFLNLYQMSAQSSTSEGKKNNISSQLSEICTEEFLNNLRTMQRSKAMSLIYVRKLSEAENLVTFDCVCLSSNGEYIRCDVVLNKATMKITDIRKSFYLAQDSKVAHEVGKDVVTAQGNNTDNAVKKSCLLSNCGMIDLGKI